MLDPEVSPTTYVDFESAYILRRNNAKNDNTWREKNRNFADTYAGSDNSTRTTLANDGKENAIRSEQCRFSGFRITANEIEYEENENGESVLNISSDLSFDAKRFPKRSDLVVTLTIKGDDGTTILNNYTLTDAEKLSWANGHSFVRLANEKPIRDYFATIPEGGTKSITLLDCDRSEDK